MELKILLEALQTCYVILVFSHMYITKKDMVEKSISLKLLNYILLPMLGLLLLEPNITNSIPIRDYILLLFGLSSIMMFMLYPLAIIPAKKTEKPKNTKQKKENSYMKLSSYIPIGILGIISILSSIVIGFRYTM